MINGDFGFWAHQNPSIRATPLAASGTADVVIVGGGYSGLWTALALHTFDPSLDIVVLEAEQFGFGASGRNGGWLSSKPVGMRQVLSGSSSREQVLDVEDRLHDTMQAIADGFTADGVDIGAAHGGWIQVARNASELTRLRASLAGHRAWGLDESRVRLVDATELRANIDIHDAVGALMSPDCIRVDPFRLLAGIVARARAAGIRLHDHSRVTDITPGVVQVGALEVRAPRIVLATEGYSSALKGRKREMLPLNSAMIATRRLTEAEWDRIGWASAAGISGSAHTYFYGQRTPDGRIVLGGRGKPYRFASGFDERGAVDDRTIAALEAIVSDLFPWLDAHAEYAWCGVLGVTRDWSPFVDWDHSTGILELGGYAGQGVTAAKLAADAGAALMLGRNDSITRIPWVRPKPRKWEPEPLRWIGANGLYRAYSAADWVEQRSSTGRTSAIAKAADIIAGR
ncbi:NAD(P)/FAD-dependent oxidoreductase [Agromyces laixinhei]|uniref:NAD(P)/FAD-dependent oxidoreductase n=1 Tax=Agromyces laixinhei TaxID=2585717 RepID=UPI0012EE0DCF|nr:FAD-dependent oxidoreductase [Agromyces laixinhei]